MKTKYLLPVLCLALAIALVACGAPAATQAPAPADTVAAPAAGDTAVAPAAGDTAAAPAGDVVAKFVFTNQGAVDICSLYLSHVSKNEWGPDQLQGQKITANGGTFTLLNIPSGTYDAKWVGCDNTQGTLQLDIKN
ncbi:MAG: hypothetical protein WA821_14865 [Anaerolineales bacterium]